MSIQTLKDRSVKILRYTEKYTKTDMVYLARSGFWSLFNQGIGSGASFVVVMLLANLLPKESFGQYRFILSAISVLTLFTLPGVGTSLLRSSALGQNIDLAKIAKGKLSWSFISSVVSFFAALYYLYLGNTLIGYALILTAVFLPFTETFYIYIAYYKGRQDFKTAAIYESISRIIQAVILVATVLLSKNMIVLLLAFFGGQFITRFFFYEKTRAYIKKQKLKPDFISGPANDSIAYGKDISGTIITSTIMGNIDKLLVWHFLGAESLAVYYVALTIPHNLGLMFNVIPRVALPKFSTNSWDAGERVKIIRKIWLFSFLLIIPALIYAFLVPFLIPLIFKSYQASIMPAIILASIIILMPANAMIEHMLYAQKSTKKIIKLQILELTVFALISFLLYQNFGINGVATALAVSGAVAFLGGIFFIKS